MKNTYMINFKSISILISITLLAACGSNTPMRPTHRPPPVNSPTTQAPPKQIPIENTTPPVSSTSSNSETKPNAGGYYLDDGPGENAPANIDNIPSAPLKTEQPSKRANKPYSALGQKYTPMTGYAPYKKQGMASWYGKRFHGKKTATGEIYDMYAMSGAHTILPIPSYAKVTNPANGRSVIVRINDRGPFKRDRLIDLSYAAAYQLRLIKQGSGLVEVETVDTSANAIANTKIAQEANTTQNTNTNSAIQTAELPVNTLQDTSTVTTTPSMPATPLISAPAIISTPSANIASSQYYVQAGAFKSETNGDLLQKKIQGLDLVENVGIANVYNNGLYRVKLGPYTSKKEADSAAANIRNQLNIATLVINQ